LIVEKKAGGWDTRTGMNLWKKPVYHLAVVCIEYPDQKHNPKITSEAWQESFSARATYIKNNILGQTVYGSVHDFYLEQSYGKIRIEGKVFDSSKSRRSATSYARAAKTCCSARRLTNSWLAMARTHWRSSTASSSLCRFAAASTTRGAQPLLPHRASVNHGGKRWPYFIVAEGGDKMANISVFAHEFGPHARACPICTPGPRPRDWKAGQWCLMSNQVGNGRPQHASAWCKEAAGVDRAGGHRPHGETKTHLGADRRFAQGHPQGAGPSRRSEYCSSRTASTRALTRACPRGLLIWAWCVASRFRGIAWHRRRRRVTRVPQAVLTLAMRMIR